MGITKKTNNWVKEPRDDETPFELKESRNLWRGLFWFTIWCVYAYLVVIHFEQPCWNLFDDENLVSGYTCTYNHSLTLTDWLWIALWLAPTLCFLGVRRVLREFFG
jgi:hypothetical protein